MKTVSENSSVINKISLKTLVTKIFNRRTVKMAIGQRFNIHVTLHAFHVDMYATSVAHRRGIKMGTTYLTVLPLALITRASVERRRHGLQQPHAAMDGSAEAADLANAHIYTRSSRPKINMKMTLLKRIKRRTLTTRKTEPVKLKMATRM